MSLQQLWTSLLQCYSPARIGFFGANLMQIIFFWFASMAYTSLPYLLPAFSARHKLQKFEKQPTPVEIWQCFCVVLRNHILSTALQFAIIAADIITGRPPSHRFDPLLPSLAEIFRDIIFCTFIREVIFYYLHRLVHHPSIYPKMHKTHHAFTPPIGLAAQYSSFGDHVLLGILPIAIPPMILKSHVVTFWIFLAMQLFETATMHSGYDFWAGFAKRHDLHHEKFNVYYGPTGLMDWIHGTSGRKERV